jgi:Resolvase, N terminal domain
MGHLVGSARVSTTDLHSQLQADALKRAGCYRVFMETASGARIDRPILAQVLDQLRPGDTLVVWKLDRLGRSLRHLVDTITGLAERAVGVRSLQEAIDTTTPGRQARPPRLRRPGRIRTRPDPGADQRRAGRGSGPWSPCGRPSVMTAHKQRVAEEMYRSEPVHRGRDRHDPGVGRASIYRYLDTSSR